MTDDEIRAHKTKQKVQMEALAAELERDDARRLAEKWRSIAIDHAPWLRASANYRFPWEQQ